jgi:hypothetical protein
MPKKRLLFNIMDYIIINGGKSQSIIGDWRIGTGEQRTENREQGLGNRVLCEASIR